MARDGSFDPKGEAAGKPNPAAATDPKSMSRLRELYQLLSRQMPLLDQACNTLPPDSETVARRLRAVGDTVSHLARHLGVQASQAESAGERAEGGASRLPATQSTAQRQRHRAAAPPPSKPGSGVGRVRQTVQIELRAAHLLAMHEPVLLTSRKCMTG